MKDAYFWYSSKQNDLKDRPDFEGRRQFRNFAKLDDGRKVEYTLMTSTTEHGAQWDDIRLLGHGKYLRSKPR